MSAQICPSCLSQKLDQGRCQSCGFNRADYWPAQQALPLDTMIGKYRIGVLKAVSRQSQVYTGIDIQASTPVLIEEFLPAKTAGRHPDDPRVLLAKNDAQNQQRFQQACRLLEESRQNRPLRKVAVLRANNTVYSVFAPMPNVPVDAQCEALADNPVFFRNEGNQPLMTINALAIPPMPRERPFSTDVKEIPQPASAQAPQVVSEVPAERAPKPKRRWLKPVLISAAAVLVLALGCVLLLSMLTHRNASDAPVPTMQVSATEQIPPIQTPETEGNDPQDSRDSQAGARISGESVAVVSGGDNQNKPEEPTGQQPGTSADEPGGRESPLPADPQKELPSGQAPDQDAPEAGAESGTEAGLKNEKNPEQTFPGPEVQAEQPATGESLPDVTEPSVQTSQTKIVSRDSLLSKLKAVILDDDTQVRIGTTNVKLEQGQVLDLRLKKVDRNREWIFFQQGGNGYDVNLKLPAETLEKAGLSANEQRDSLLRIYTLPGGKVTQSANVQVVLCALEDFGALKAGSLLAPENVEDLIRIQAAFLNDAEATLCMAMREEQYYVQVSYHDKTGDHQALYPVRAFEPPVKETPDASATPLGAGGQYRPY